MFSDMLKKLRKNYDISQKDLSAVLFVSQQAVAKWETNGSSPNPEMILKIADFFNVSTDYLLGHDESKMNTAKANKTCLNVAPSAQLPNGALKVAEKYAVAPDGIQSAVRKLLDIAENNLEISRGSDIG